MSWTFVSNVYRRSDSRTDDLGLVIFSRNRFLQTGVCMKFEGTTGGLNTCSMETREGISWGE